MIFSLLALFLLPVNCNNQSNTDQGISPRQRGEKPERVAGKGDRVAAAGPYVHSAV